MKELEIEVRVRNNLLKTRRLALGFNQTQMAEAIGCSQAAYGALEAMRVPPICKDGTWRKGVENLASYYGVDPEDLFPDAIQAVDKNKAVRYVDVKDVPSLIGVGSHSAAMLTASPDELAGQLELRKRIETVLPTLSPREEEVIRRRFGIGCIAQTQAIIGQDFGVGGGRIQQIEAKALRKLRHPKSSKHLRDFVRPDDYDYVIIKKRSS